MTVVVIPREGFTPERLLAMLCEVVREGLAADATDAQRAAGLAALGEIQTAVLA